jgi:hypothetical protein
MTPLGAAIPPPASAPAAAPRRRCVRHESREAVARCVSCGGGFCRECITEHDDRLYCATCFELPAAAARRSGGGAGLAGRLKPILAASGSLLCVVLAFYLLGRVLAAIPSDFHDGTVWRENLRP